MCRALCAQLPQAPLLICMFCSPFLWLQLPPPSYADSVYFDRAEITPQEASGDSRAVAADDGALAGSLTVAVTSPEKRTDSSSALGRLAGKKYVAFAVAYRAEGLPAFAAAPAGAPRRRFRDFVGLAARLVRPLLLIS
jgi:hypothetical protein